MQDIDFISKKFSNIAQPISFIKDKLSKNENKINTAVILCGGKGTRLDICQKNAKIFSACKK